MNTLYSLRVAEYNKNEFQSLQDLKNRRVFVKFQFNLGYVEEQFLGVVSVNSHKNGSFMVDV